MSAAGVVEIAQNIQETKAQLEVESSPPPLPNVRLLIEGARELLTTKTYVDFINATDRRAQYLQAVGPDALKFAIVGLESLIKKYEGAKGKDAETYGRAIKRGTDQLITRIERIFKYMPSSML